MYVYLSKQNRAAHRVARVTSPQLGKVNVCATTMRTCCVHYPIVTRSSECQLLDSPGRLIKRGAGVPTQMGWNHILIGGGISGC